MIPVALVVRVSTKEQDYSESSDRRQVADLTTYAKRQDYEIVHIIHETGSATKRSNRDGGPFDRPEFDNLLDLSRKKSIRKVLVTEFSRLGRRRSETPALMEAITQEGVSIYAHNLGLETLLANGKRNPVAGIVIAPGGRSRDDRAGWPEPSTRWKPSGFPIESCQVWIKPGVMAHDWVGHPAPRKQKKSFWPLFQVCLKTLGKG